MENETSDMSIKDKLDLLISYMNKEQDKEKKFHLPWKIRLQRMLFTRRKYVVIMLIRSNGSVIFKKVKPEDNTIKVGDTIYDASADYVLRYKRYPLIIQPEWSMKPFSPAESFKQTVEEGTLTSTEKVIMAKMEKDLIKPKWQGNIGMILLILGLLVGGLWALNHFNIIKF